MSLKIIPVAEPAFFGNEEKYVAECVKTRWVSSLGKFVPEFESQFAKFCGSKYGVAVFNGTVALHLALVAYGIGQGDEVIVPTLTFVATSNTVLYTGATPVFVDSEPETWNMDPKKIEQVITKKTKAIIVVHLYGHPAEMDAILKIAKKHHLVVIEDAAEAHGAEFRGKRVGSMGDVGCFSFYGNKILTTGEGGIIVTNNKKIAQRMQFLKDHCMSYTRRYYHSEMGFNYRMTNVQAALGLAQLEHVDLFMKRKREIAQQYEKYLRDISWLELPPAKKWAKTIYWMYSIILKPGAPITRDALMDLLAKNKIDTRPFFIPNHTFPYFKKETRRMKFPVADHLGKNGMNLPSSVLLSEEDVRRVCEVIRSVRKKLPSLKANYQLFKKENETAVKKFFQFLSPQTIETFHPHPFTDEFLDKILSLSDQTHHLRIGAFSQKEMVGYAFLSLPPGLSHIGYFGIVVGEKFRGRGLGEGLMKNLFGEARKRGVKEIYLNVYETNFSAIRLYKKMGFKKIEVPFFLGKVFTMYENIYNGNLSEMAQDVLKKIMSSGSVKNEASSKSIWMRAKV